MKILKQTGRTAELVIPQDAFEDRRQEAYWAKPARERALDALVIANRVIKQQIARQTDAKRSETVKIRR